MKNRILIIGGVVFMSLVLATCKDDDDPGLQLTEKISFLWNTHASPTTSTRWFAVLSDTSGNLIEWKELENNIVLEMSYPSDPKQATLTIIRKDFPDRTYLQMWTHTGLEAKLYNYEEPLLQNEPEGDDRFKFSFKGLETFVPYMTGQCHQKDYEFDEVNSTWTASWDMYDNETNNLFVSTQQTDNINEDRRYLYMEDVDHSDSLGVSAETLNTLSTQSYHIINYPTHQQAKSGEGTYVYLYGHGADGVFYNLDRRIWQKDQPLKISYPEIPNLFPEFQTQVFGYTTNGDYNYIGISGASPVLDVQSMTTTLDKVIEASTKRLAVDLTGEGDVINLGKSVSNNTLYITHNIIIPVSSRVRITLPKFSDDLLEEIPALTELNDKPFESIAVFDWGPSYQEVFESKLVNGFWSQPVDLRSKVFTVNGGAGRIAPDARDVMKMFTTNPLQKSANDPR